MTKIVLTYEDFVALPDDGKRYELHEGELSVTPAPGTRHQEVLLNLTLILAPYVRSSGHGKFFLSPFDYIMSEITIVEPDLLYLDDSRLRLVSDRGIEGAPTSPSRSSPHTRGKSIVGERWPSTPPTTSRGTGSSIPRRAPSRAIDSTTARTISSRSWKAPSRARFRRS